MKIILSVLATLLIVGCQQKINPAAVQGNWEFRFYPDTEGEVLQLKMNGKKWSGVMNGLERAGEHGLFYYVVALSDIVVETNGIVTFTVGPRAFHVKRPALSDLSVNNGDDSGGSGSPLYFFGKYINDELVLNCRSAFHDCPNDKMRFTRIKQEPSKTDE